MLITQAKRLSLDPPSSGTFLRGRLTYAWSTGGPFSVRYGIEAWFAPKEKAEAIERSIRNLPPLQFGPNGEPIEAETPPVRAHVAVTSSGKAGLVDLELP